jgi:hypothetical protein
MYKGTLIDNLLGVVESAEKSSAVPTTNGEGNNESIPAGNESESEPEQFA